MTDFVSETQRTISIDEIKVDESIDPRSEVRSDTKIHEYLDNIDRMPPILVDQNNRILDGIHRYKAHLLDNRDTIKVEVVEVDDDTDAFIKSVKWNAIHGIQLSEFDKKNIAIKLWRFGVSDQESSEILSLSSRTIHRHVAEAKNQLKEDRKNSVSVLSAEGFSTREIAKILNEESPHPITGETVRKYLIQYIESLVITKHNNGWSVEQIEADLIKMHPEQVKNGLVSKTLENYVPKFTEELDDDVEGVVEATTEVEPTTEAEVQERAEAKSDVDEEKDQDSNRIHVKMQYKLLELGTKMGLKVWVASDDRSKSFEGKLFSELPAMLSTLPTNVRARVSQSSERVDVLWLENNKVVAAFEVEHSTSIDSGLLRMSDMSIELNDADIAINIVAPSDRLEEVRKKLNRSTYKKLGLTNSCRFISYDDLANKFNDVMNTAETHDGWQDLLDEIAFKL